MSEVGGGSGRRRLLDEDFTLQVYPGSISPDVIYCPVPARRHTTAADVIDALITALRLDRAKCYVLAEVKEFGGEEWILNPTDCPVQRMMLWPRLALEARGSGEDYRFLLREKNVDGSIHYGSLQSWLKVTEERRRMVERGFLPQEQGPECEDLCGLPDLSERALLETLRTRFRQEKIYTYVGSILVAVNPFRFLPIYNPKYVKMYDNRRLGDREPHIYAVADAAYHAMLRRQRNQCIVISGETGSGKTQSTNFLIHHLTALSQKGYASGVEQIILGAGPVLEAFGNAKTSQNNNSSRFGKFIQVNYHETGTVRGAYVEKYLLEKSRLVYQEQLERNYHVFYYLLAGASEEEKAEFHLDLPETYHYLNQRQRKPQRQNWEDYDGEDEADSLSGEGEDLRHDFERLQLAMEMVGFLAATRKQIVSLLSAILHLGNIQYKRKTYRDESIDISNPDTLHIVSDLLKVREEMLLDALITRKTVTVGEKLILPYRLPEAVTVRDSLAKSLYSALFDWIVFRINHALLNINNKAIDEGSQTLSIGVLDIFGFEDYGSNSFEQFCINFANERLQHYFNQHLFQLEQEQYRLEGISWSNINYTNNEGCINLISKRPTGLIQLLDEESNFPQATHQTLLEKFKRHHEGNPYIEFPAVREPAFIIQHYAGKVKYGVKEFREKNTDHMRPDIVALLRSSRNAFIRGMIASSPVAAFRWALLRACFRALWAFKQSGKNGMGKKTGSGPLSTPGPPGSSHKGLSSFSFLQHPVHQRSLQILQRCQNDQYNIPRPTPRTPLSDLQGVNTIQERSPRELTWSTRRHRLSSNNSYLEGGGIFISSSSSNMNNNDSKLLERAHGILMRNKCTKSKPTLPKHLLDVKSLKHLSNLTLHDRITKSLLHLHKKKKPPSISAQFQASLNKLMETLGQAEPYFVKCIRSNAEKVPLRFNDSLVLRQLRYTGMLETVRIRQSGYSCKVPFQDFVTQFSVFLPKNVTSTRQSIQEFFWKMGHSPDQYQVGKTMVFLKEQERQLLRDMLHQTVLQRIILLQRWIRAMLQRKRFLHLKDAAITIQRYWRHYKKRWSEQEMQARDDTLYQAACIIQSWWKGYKARRDYQQIKESTAIIQTVWQKCWLRRQTAAICIQTTWRGHVARTQYKCKRKHIITLQAACRGFIARRRVRSIKQELPIHLMQDNSLEDNSNAVFKSPLQSPDTDVSHWEDISEHSQSNPASATLPGRGGEVQFRERPKSLEDPNQRKVVRAKRESRRMRELEQAQFSLELLKVRSSGGMSPSDERRWSAELILDKVPDTPESEGSFGSLELISCEENSKPSEEPTPIMVSCNQPSGSPTHRHPKISREVSQDSLKMPSSLISQELSDSLITEPMSTQSCQSVSSITRDLANTTRNETQTTYSKPTSLSDEEYQSSCISSQISSNSSPLIAHSNGPQGISHSGTTFSHSNGIPCASSRENSDSGREENVSSNGHLTSPLQSSLPSLAVQGTPVSDIKAPPKQKDASPENQQCSVSHHPPSPSTNAVDIAWSSSSSWRQTPEIHELSESAPAKTSVLFPYKTHTREPQLSCSLPTFYVPNQGLLRTQEHNDLGVAPSDTVLQRLQKLNKEKEELQKQLQQEKERLMMEQIRKEKQELDRQRKLQEQHGHNRDSDNSLHLLRSSTKKQSDRPQSLLLQGTHWKSPTSKTEIKGLTVKGKTGLVSHSDRPVSMFLDHRELREAPKGDVTGDIGDSGKRPWLHSTVNSNIFFTPKGNISSDSDNSSVQHPRSARSDLSKRLDATEPSGMIEAPHRRKARMARTRSDFMTRGALGGGDSEEDSDEQGERIPPSDPAEESGRQIQACHSDSEMMLQKAQGMERLSKLQKAMSQGEMPRVPPAHRTTEQDSRPQRGKIRFWGKMKAAEKLTPQTEVLEMDKEGIHFNDGDPGLWLAPHSPDLSRGREKENKDPSPKVQRRRSVKISSAAMEPAQWQDERAQIICSASDLKCMDEFLLKKISDLDSEDGKKDSMVDVLFKRALKEFRQNIFSLYSSSLMGEDGKSIRYRDLGALFEQILDKTMKQHQQRSWNESPVRVWINTFKVFLDEFVTEYKPLNYTLGKTQKPERKKRRKKESDIVEEHNGHIFKATQYNIPTYCEFCSSLIWIMDRAAVCKLCRFACHKKCCSQITTTCSKKYDHELSNRHFGVELSRLTNEDRTVPVLLEKLISYIEMHGLYTEGIYRKPGSTNKIRELRQNLDTDIDNVNLDDYNIHVIASVFKQWLRELPNPLMTFELYEEFLRSMGLGEKKETVRGVYSIIDQLSRTHLSTLERLIFHLVRIAQQEETNRMSANALAIVFAPCILRCPDTTDPLQSVQDIGKTTACVELIVLEQMNKYKARLKDINSLEFAENKAKSRLSLIRRSMASKRPVKNERSDLIGCYGQLHRSSSTQGKGRLRSNLSPVISGRSPVLDAAGDHGLSTIPSEDESSEQKEAAMQQEERVLAQQIETLQKEKEELAYEMLALEPRASDDETLESEASLGTADSSENLNCESEGAASIRAERALVLSSMRGPRTEATRVRRPVKRENDSTDSGDRNLSSPTASSCLPHLGRKRFHLHSKSPFYREPPSADSQDSGAPGHFTSRGTFNPEKGRQKLKNVKQSPQKPRDPPESGEQRILGSDGSSQSVVLFGSNEFMV